MKVAHAQHQSEAEFLQDLLRQHGVSSVLRRSAGFDVPDFLAAGPRDVLVAASQVLLARDVLLESDEASEEDERPMSTIAVGDNHGLLGRASELTALLRETQEGARSNRAASPTSRRPSAIPVDPRRAD